MVEYVMIPKIEYEFLKGIEPRIKNLELGMMAILNPTLESEKQIMSKEDACEYCRLSLDGLNKARREGRILGVKLNEKEYGYKKSELDKYLNRYRKYYDRHSISENKCRDSER